MTTPEQQAREMLERMGIQSAYQRMSAGELVELANLIAERDALKAELEAIKGAGEPVAWLFKAHKPGKHVVCAGLTQEAVGLWPLDQWDYVEETPLYTRPCVPLTDESELLEALKRLSFAAQTTGGVAGQDEGLCAAIDAATAVIAKVVAHTKGAKG